MGGALLGLLKSAGSVLLGKTATDGAGLLGAEVKREVLLVLVEETELSPLLGVDDGEDTSDRLAEVVAVKKCACQPTHSFLPDIPKDSSKSHFLVLVVLVIRGGIGGSGIDVHLVELGARRDDLLDAKLTQLSLQLTELLGELVLVLGPESAGLDLSRRL